MNHKPLNCSFSLAEEKSIIKTSKGVWKSKINSRYHSELFITNSSSDSLHVTLATLTADVERESKSRSKSLRIERWLEDQAGKRIEPNEIKKNQTYRMRCLIENVSDMDIYKVCTRQVFPYEWTAESLVDKNVNQAYIKESSWMAEIPRIRAQEVVEMVYEFTPSYAGSIALESFRASCVMGIEAYASSEKMNLHVSN